MSRDGSNQNPTNQSPPDSGGSQTKDATHQELRNDPHSSVGRSAGAADSDSPQFRAFTRESLDKINERTNEIIKNRGRLPNRTPTIEDGSVLPLRLEPFPGHLYGKPLEEIDQFLLEETFCAVGKRFRKNYIHRFHASKALFLFAPWNPIRKAAVYISTNQYFDYLIIFSILANCVFLAMTHPPEITEYIFLGIYTVELVMKSVSKGMILNKYSYLRNGWNWLDFILIFTGYLTMAVEVANLSGLRTFRVLRALKTVSILPSLRTIINALLHSIKQLAEVMTLTVFCLMVFALFALQVYMGQLLNKCIRVLPDNSTDYQTWINNSSNWYYGDSEQPLICGNVSGARKCVEGYSCLPGVGDNPNFGYTNFDNFLWSMLTTFQLITLDFWEDVYNKVISAVGPFHVVFFAVVVFFGSFYLINLMLAVVALSYEEEAEGTSDEIKQQQHEEQQKLQQKQQQQQQTQMQHYIQKSPLSPVQVW